MPFSFSDDYREKLIDILVDEALLLPGGTETSLSELFHRVYPEEDLDIDHCGYDLLEDFVKAAKKKGLFLDMSKHEGLIEGLPYRMVFKIYQKKSGKKCPLCGGRDTAKILYGMPSFSENFQNDLEHHRTYIGGCCIDPFKAKYHCFCCDNVTDNPEWQ